MATPPFLTIGIPTWNRGKYLNNNLTQLIDQIEIQGLSDVVEILVSDNASTDDTAALCEAHAHAHAFICYVRQTENQGANANFEYVIAHGKGEYIWLLGDDDLLAPTIIARVINDIKAYSPDVITGAAIFDTTLEKATHLHYSTHVLSNQTLLENEDIIGLVGKMSGLIFKKESVLPHLEKMNPLIQAIRTPWPHLAWCLSLMNDKNKKILVLPYGINQLVQDNWFNLLFDGEILIQLHLTAYQQLLIALKPYLNTAFQQNLMKQSVAGKPQILIKCILYATYLNPYFSFMRFSFKTLPAIQGYKNKLFYTLFLMLPAMVPVSLRKTGCYLASKKSGKLAVTIARLTKACAMKSGHDAERQFDAAQL